MKRPPLISVCIPAYNRVSLLPELLDSIFAQVGVAFDVVIAEDCSPERTAIRDVAEKYANQNPGRVTYRENPVNLGYDGNLRQLLALASGEYVLFMGNDDLMCPDALSIVSAALHRYPNIGVVLRSYAVFEESPDNIVQTFRYFIDERFFPAGPQTIATIYRRAVVIPGLVLHRNSAIRYATDRFDGTLLYQLYLVAEILAQMNAVFIPDIIVLYRAGGIPDFGNSVAERGKFKPRAQTPESSLLFISGMLRIARSVEMARGLPIYRPILKDIANYSYPLLAIQAKRPLKIYLKYGASLARMGFWHYPLFWVYWTSILLCGTNRMDRLICWIKLRLGHTLTLGKIYKGESW